MNYLSCNEEWLTYVNFSTKQSKLMLLIWTYSKTFIKQPHVEVGQLQYQYNAGVIVKLIHLSELQSALN